MRVTVSFVTTYEFDDFIEKKAKELGMSKSSYVEQILSDYFSRIGKDITPQRFIFMPRQKTFLSIKLDKDLNWKIKHQALLCNVTKQDIFNCAIAEAIKRDNGK